MIVNNDDNVISLTLGLDTSWCLHENGSLAEDDKPTTLR